MMEDLRRAQGISERLEMLAGELSVADSPEKLEKLVDKLLALAGEMRSC